MGDCVICFDKLDSYVTLKCTHKYHKNCIKNWQKKSNTCPNCRKQIIIIKNNYAYLDKIDISPKYTYCPKKYISTYAYTPSDYNSLYNYEIPEYNSFEIPEEINTPSTLLT